MHIKGLSKAFKSPSHSKFWKKVLNWEYLAETGMINKEDLKLFKFCDTVDDAFKFITAALEKQEGDSVAQGWHRK